MYRFKMCEIFVVNDGIPCVHCLSAIAAEKREETGRKQYSIKYKDERLRVVRFGRNPTLPLRFKATIASQDQRFVQCISMTKLSFPNTVCTSAVK